MSKISRSEKVKKKALLLHLFQGCPCELLLGHARPASNRNQRIIYILSFASLQRCFEV